MTEHAHTSDPKSWALGMIYLIVKISEENTVVSETIHLAFSICGALMIVAFSHFFSIYLKYKFPEKTFSTWKIWTLFKKK